MCIIWVTLWPTAVIIYFKFIFLINAASVGAVIDVSTLLGMFNGHRSPQKAIIQPLPPLPGITLLTMSQRDVCVLLSDLIFHCFFFFFYIIPTVWNIPACFQWNPSGFQGGACRAIFGPMHYCAKCTVVFKECFFSPLQDSHFWTIGVRWFMASLESLSIKPT